MNLDVYEFIELFDIGSMDLIIWCNDDFYNKYDFKDILNARSEQVAYKDFNIDLMKVEEVYQNENGANVIVIRDDNK